MNMKDDSDLKTVCLELMEITHPAYLTTIDNEGFPQTRAMFNLRNKEMWPRLVPLFENCMDDFMILFTTNTSSTKIQDILKNRAVSVYYCQPEKSRGVHFGGLIEVVDDLEIKKAIWHDGWEKYYPQGYDDSDHSVLRLYPTIVKGWNQSHTFHFEL